MIVCEAFSWKAVLITFWQNLTHMYKEELLFLKYQMLSAETQQEEG